ncbi:hypothetical protein CANCADRAFT_32677 [Tortispora caseinolytica NRRL Y-17796]|uniref:W2 domain-containing protein n=1 Tax=Tortispora caseinolytica NRRL Y-17796 TaxID=767744 RepID=A0A1E4TCN9_9ASCO|nr:hypothetical protein CANCADRAFT_32677 [Tortispora caseinolytica NRRL Y-17796]
MSLINVQRDNTDPFYRYKMPAIQSKVVGRGNGIRTFVTNTKEVARALNRPPTYVNKFFGFELGAQTSANESEDRWVVNGVHEPAKLQDLLDVFINKFVLCKSCKNPETEFVISKDGSISLDCKACGTRSPVELTHKLTAYISKHPPPQKKQKGKKAAATATSNVGGADADADEETHGSDDELTRRIASEASALPDADRDYDDEWTVDTSEAAVQARMKELASAVGNVALTGEKEEDDDASGAANAFSEFGDWISSQDELPSDVDIYKKAQELDIVDNSRTLQVLAQTLFTENIVEEVKEHAGLLKKLITSPSHEKAFLGGTERFIGTQHPDLIPVVSKILYEYYERDIISEDVVSKWGSRASKKYVDKEMSKKIRKSAAPFLEWLSQSDDENEEEEEEDEE